MSTTEPYFPFPLASLHGIYKLSTPYQILDLCLDFGIFNAGTGYRKNNDSDDFKERLIEACDEKEISISNRPKPNTDHATVLVGAALCGVSLGGTSASYCNKMVDLSSKGPKGGPLVRMSSTSFWAALHQARWEANKAANSRPDRGISFTEFRVLSAILRRSTSDTWASDCPNHRTGTQTYCRIRSPCPRHRPRRRGPPARAGCSSSHSSRPGRCAWRASHSPWEPSSRSHLALGRAFQHGNALLVAGHRIRSRRSASLALPERPVVSITSTTAQPFPPAAWRSS